MSEIEFKRFSKDKQEQVRQFVAYAQMMGLTGKDIRSIGDKLDRLRKADERKANLEIIKTFNCIPIGDDRKQNGARLEDALDDRFKLKTAKGTYKFKYNYGVWTIESLSTKVIQNYKFDYWAYELSTSCWSRRFRQALLLEIALGKLKLDF